MAAAGRRLRFLANVDPVDVSRALDGLNPETTLVVIVSKTMTTAETMLNARTLRRWLYAGMWKSEAVVRVCVCVESFVMYRTGRGAHGGRVCQCEGGSRVWHPIGTRLRVLGLGRRPLQVGRCAIKIVCFCASLMCGMCAAYAQPWE